MVCINSDSVKELKNISLFLDAKEVDSDFIKSKSPCAVMEAWNLDLLLGTIYKDSDSDSYYVEFENESKICGV